MGHDRSGDACPGVPVSLSTSAEIEPDPRRRRQLVVNWNVLPDLVTANQGEDAIVELCEDLMARGVGIEAGVLSLADAEAFVRSRLAECCVRVLVEPLDADPQEAVGHAAAIKASRSAITFRSAIRSPCGSDTIATRQGSVPGRLCWFSVIANR